MGKKHSEKLYFRPINKPEVVKIFLTKINYFDLSDKYILLVHASSRSDRITLDKCGTSPIVTLLQNSLPGNLYNYSTYEVVPEAIEWLRGAGLIVDGYEIVDGEIVPSKVMRLILPTTDTFAFVKELMFGELPEVE